MWQDGVSAWKNGAAVPENQSDVPEKRDGARQRHGIAVGAGLAGDLAEDEIVTRKVRQRPKRGGVLRRAPVLGERGFTQQQTTEVVLSVLAAQEAEAQNS